GLDVPDVLLSGHHGLIRRWRLKEALRRTLLRRPDLLEHRKLSEEERLILAELAQDLGKEEEQ
ncbi:MAG TPA: tRNA (guanosine(37)-N1)-methyltransferase TrmD, partial [Firmicutes bacterium]|nr:tRNA (guanosine(37)-N1)-methyltransferase TrmD [Bacillota bacterium]